MLSKSLAFSFTYIVCAIIITTLYAIGVVGDSIMQAGFNPEMAGLFTAAALFALGALAAICGGHGMTISVAGITLAFCVLVAHEQPLVRYMTLSALLFSIGMYGMVVSRNAVRMLMSIELMLNAVNINMVALARYIDPIAVRGQLFAIFILTVAAAEAAVGLAIVLAIYRNNATIDMEKFNTLKW